MKRAIQGAAVALAAAAVLLAPSLLIPCPTEDHATACHWDATTQGNGTGSSFLVTLTGHTIPLPGGTK